jgi:hypothetical protein
MNPENNGVNNGVTLAPGPVGGMLKTGGTPGNKGGTGRPPSAIRAKYRELLSIHAETIATNILLSGNDRTKVAMLDHLGKFGLGEPKILVEEELMQAVMDVAFKMFPSEATAFMEALDARLRETA